MSFKWHSRIPRRINTTALGKEKYSVCNNFDHATVGKIQSFMFKVIKLVRQEKMV